jgi:ribosomal protein S21
MSKRPVNVEVTPRYRNESAEKMIKRFNKKVKNERIIEDFRERQRYEKPSLKRKRLKLRKRLVLEKLQKTIDEKKKLTS